MYIFINYFIVTSGLEIEYSIHDFLGSSRLSSTTIMPIKFIQINLSHKNTENKLKKFDFVVAED